MVKENKTKTVDKILIGIFMVMVAYISIFGYIIIHEGLHGDICERFGGKPQIYIYPFSGKTVCEFEDIPLEYQLEAAKLNTMVDIIGYHYVHFHIIIAMIIFMFYFRKK